MYLYSIRDVKAETFDTPFPAAKDVVAVRMFSDLVNRKDNLIGQHPEDFELYRLGFFDPATGCLFRDPESASEYVKSPDKVDLILPFLVSPAIILVRSDEE